MSFDVLLLLGVALTVVVHLIALRRVSYRRAGRR
jgi:hypothetical protein